MTITTGWKNKNGTADRSCSCGTWKKHWIKQSGKAWPSDCSRYSCTSIPTLGAHVINPSVTGEKITPMCTSCNGLSGEFNLVSGIILVSANKAVTCG